MSTSEVRVSNRKGRPNYPPALTGAIKATDQREPESVDSTLAMASCIEIELNGARVQVRGKVDPTQLRLVLRCLMPV